MPPSDPSNTGPRLLLSARGIHILAGCVEPDGDHGDDLPALASTGGEAALRETLSLFGAEHRAQHLTARRWVRRIVTERLRRPWHGFEPAPRGVKPRLRDSTLDVSIAHSGDRVVVGVVEHGRIGVDVELVAPVFEQPALIRRLCSSAERRRLEAMAPGTRAGWLTQLWTVKESYAKAVGAGLALDFRDLHAARLPHRHDVRGVLTPATGDARAKIAVSWVDGTSARGASPA